MRTRVTTEQMTDQPRVHKTSITKRAITKPSRSNQAAVRKPQRAVARGGGRRRMSDDDSGRALASRGRGDQVERCPHAVRIEIDGPRICQHVLPSMHE